MEQPDFQSFLAKEVVPVHFCKLEHVKDVFQLCIFIHAGSFQEPEGKEGLAHFFEHIPFRGTHKFRNPLDIWKARELIFPINGMNAFTSREIICFHGKITKAKKIEAIDFLKELCFFPIIEEDSINEERKVIASEFARKYQTSFDYEITKKHWKSVYGNHPYARLISPLGNKQSLEMVNQEGLIKFMSNFFNLNNIEIAMIGDIGLVEAEEVVKLLFRDVNLPKGIITQFLAPIKSWPKPKFHKAVISHKDELGLKKPQRYSTQISAVAGYPKKNNWIESFSLAVFFRFILFCEARIKLSATYGIQSVFYDFCDHGLLEIGTHINPKKENTVISAIEKSLLSFAEENEEMKIFFNQLKERLINNWETEEPTIGSYFERTWNLLQGRGAIESMDNSFLMMKNLDFYKLSSFIRNDIIPNLSWMIVRP